jgi:hypothetical protein
MFTAAPREGVNSGNCNSLIGGTILALNGTAGEEGEIGAESMSRGLGHRGLGQRYSAFPLCRHNPRNPDSVTIWHALMPMNADFSACRTWAWCCFGGVVHASASRTRGSFATAFATISEPSSGH